MNYPTKDEIQSHVRMFNPKINTSYYDMAKQSVALIHYAIRSYQAKTDNNIKVFTKPVISPMNPAFDSDLDLD
ncbi:hypothetical protein K502DRAFT_246614 [Neoconidiobolus thromboides FSU 785]|nr:hypothetical protein K502DRAFT_246614 [Neoconidiobolus thromboides FSU 785]